MTRAPRPQPEPGTTAPDPADLPPVVDRADSPRTTWRTPVDPPARPA